MKGATGRVILRARSGRATGALRRHAGRAVGRPVLCAARHVRPTVGVCVVSV